MSRKTLTIVAAVAVLILLAAGLTFWLTQRGGEAETRGSCGGSTYELQVEQEDGATQVSFELQTSGPGAVWDVAVTQGDVNLIEAQRTTDEDGELQVETIADEDGDDQFSVTATPVDATADDAPCEVTLQR